ncbi:efflux RND transporter periplasmic adaptor subunit [Marivita hallyeonensis]|uniref:RND family efflux transporter, MFP subunit n=1 Tax=Marivita hallyeonensis TaxID=996342 RepID=A0A1M5X401_9RHOB|nr:efflux RND transporter periplasmic adaptor subunit [Marivita hallyeonensis]SHH94560.1 RND family efflux transporter, MFP subunit [Marivita hallyeonensis]
MSDATKPSFLRRAGRWVISTTLTLSVVAAAGAAVFFGANTLAERAEAIEPPVEADLTKVSVSPIRIESRYTVPRRFVGQVESGANVALSFELGGRLTDLLVEEGDSVTKGQEIARLDTALLEAERTRLGASRSATASQLDFAESRVVRAEALREEGFASQEALDQARSTRDELRNRIAEIDAALTSVRINIDKSVLYAPFDGQVGAQSVDGGETLAAGQAVLTLLETGTPEVRVGLPLSLSPDILKDAQVDVGGTVYPARLRHLRPDIDPVTRTRTALFEIEATSAPIFGQTATLMLQTEKAIEGAWVPLDALREGSGSVWTVLVVEDGVVRNAAVEVLHAEETRVYVQGTFEDGTPLIDTGAHRVVPGQAVQVLDAEG